MTASKEFYRRRALRDIEEAFAPTPYQERARRESERRFEEAKKRLAAEQKARSEREAREEAERKANRERLEREGQEAFNQRVEAYIAKRRQQLSLMIGGQALEDRLVRERQAYIDRYLAANEAQAVADAVSIAKGDGGGSGARPFDMERIPVD